MRAMKFRFHTGSIKSKEYHTSTDSLPVAVFDSILVRLKDSLTPTLPAGATVSIPYWFD